MEASKADTAVHLGEDQTVDLLAEEIGRGSDGQELVSVARAAYFHAGLSLFDSLSVSLQASASVGEDV